MSVRLQVSCVAVAHDGFGKYVRADAHIKAMSRYDLAVFDFDGTLADSAAWFFGSLNEAAGRFGFRTTTEDERHALRRLGNREIIRRLRVPMWKLPAIARHMRRRAAENVDSIRLFQGIPEALTTLRNKGTRLAIVSSNSEANVRRIIGGPLAGQIAFYGCGASLFGKTSKLRSAIRHCGADRARHLRRRRNARHRGCPGGGGGIRCGRVGLRRGGGAARPQSHDRLSRRRAARPDVSNCAVSRDVQISFSPLRLACPSFPTMM